MYSSCFDIEKRVISIGGVASTALLAHLENHNRPAIKMHEQRKHTIDPSFLIHNDETPYRFLFTIGNPYNILLSLWRRNFQDIHEVSMSFGKNWFESPLEFTQRVITKGMSLTEYLENGIDAFHMMEHIDNWINYKITGNAKILIVKYENYQRYLKDILEFFDCDRSFNFRPRSSDWTKEQTYVKELMEKVYGDVKRKIDRLPPLMKKGNF